jgi:hypothetical protein
MDAKDSGIESITGYLHHDSVVWSRIRFDDNNSVGYASSIGTLWMAMMDSSPLSSVIVGGSV